MTRYDLELDALAGRIDAILKGLREGSMPLARLLRLLGYTMRPEAPLGHPCNRRAAQKALYLLHTRGCWSITMRELSDDPNPLGNGEGEIADDLWFLFAEPGRREVRSLPTPRLYVTVTQEHIDRGQRGEFHSCPIALALQEQHGGRWLTGVNHAVSFPNRKWKRPPHAQQFILEFDALEPVLPFGFTATREEDI